MALNKAKLAKDIYDAFQSGSASSDGMAQWRVSNKLSLAIYNYLIQATVKTTLDPTCIGNGGVNASIPPPSGPTPGPITVPVPCTGTTTGTLS
tara:strand:- start:223 stop:501 length:279 start_codon:yes stop_codon:yes gene_type:complete